MRRSVPCTNQFRSVPFYIENIIYIFYKTRYTNEEVSCTEPFPSVSIPWLDEARKISLIWCYDNLPNDSKPKYNMTTPLKQANQVANEWLIQQTPTKTHSPTLAPRDECCLAYSHSLHFYYLIKTVRLFCKRNWGSMQ